MLRKILLPTILVVLAYGLWVSPELKEIAAGVAIFLFGMLSLEQGFRIFSGGVLERILRKSTDRLYKSLGFGFMAATIMQSSSLVSVITISFLSAGMISLYAGLGIVFGANLGTTTGAWLLAGFGLKVKISAYALPMLVFGIILIFQKAKEFKGIGYILAGVGFLFLGIHHMKEGFNSFQGSIDLAAYAVDGFAGVLLYTAIGIVATVIMQSSHATLVLVITALASNQVTYENALALTIGANIGTTITAVIGSIGANIQGRRFALGDVLFKVTAGIVCILALQPVLTLVSAISDALGIAADDYTLRLAVFHSLFNVVGALIMSPLLHHMVRLLEKLMPEQEPELTRPVYLLESALEFADAALEAVRNETAHMYDNAFLVMAHGIELQREDIRSDRDLKDVIANQKERIEIDIDERYEATLKVLYAAIVEFTSKARTNLSPEEGERLDAYRVASRHLVESVKSVKHLRKNLAVHLGSDNPHVREAYNDIRLRIGNVMRHLDQFRQAAERGEDVEVSDLDALRLEVQEADVLASGTIDDLIRDDLISAQVASSLMNDSSYTYYTVNHLIAMAESIYGAEDLQERQAELAVALSEEDLDEIARDEHPDVQVTLPQHLSQRAPMTADFAIEAMRLEVNNLYDKAFATISRGVDLHRTEVLSDRPLRELVSGRQSRIEIDIDEDYDQTVKVLYSAIVMFVSKAQDQLDQDAVQRLLRMRVAAREVVEAVKAVKHMRKNLLHYIGEDNEHIRQAYNDLRIMLGEVMRELEAIRARTAQGDVESLRLLASLKQQVRAADVLSNGIVDRLVREDLVPPAVATSLMNDSAYAQHCAIHMINMASCVFAQQDVDTTEGAQ